MKEVLVVNLTRMGDLLQTTPVMAGLKAQYPGVRITLLVNAAFAGACRIVPFADRVIEFDVAAVKALLRDPRATFVAPYRILEEALGRVNEVEYDLVLNFTHTHDSALISSLVRGKEVRGITAGPCGERRIEHPWQRYLFQVVLSRAYNPIHLCDIYARAAGVRPPAVRLHAVFSPRAAEAARALLASAGVEDGRPLVALQAGASHPLKRWPAASFAEAARLIARGAQAQIVLVGSAGEEELGAAFRAAFAGPFADLVGRTDVETLAEVLRRCRLLVSNDTGPLHVATAVGTQVIDLSLGHVSFRETGPYGEGHYVIEARLPCVPCAFHVECTDPVCWKAVRPEAVADLAIRLLRGEEPERLDDRFPWDTVQVYRSFAGEDGLVDYRPLVMRPPAPESLWACLFRRTWPAVLDGRAPASVGAERARLAAAIRRDHGEDALREAAATLEQGLGPLHELRALVEAARVRVALIAREAGRGGGGDAVRIRHLWEAVPEIDRRIDLFARAHPFLMPLAAHFRYGREVLGGEGLAEQARGAAALYAELSGHLDRLIALVESMASAAGMEGPCRGAERGVSDPPAAEVAP